MKCLNKRAEAIFRQLIDGLNEPGDHRKIDNSGGTFMALSIDVLSVERQTVAGRDRYEMRVALAHNLVQNGDLMADPDVEFLVTPLSRRAADVPARPRHLSPLGVEGDGQWRYHPHGQADLRRSATSGYRTSRLSSGMGDRGRFFLRRLSRERKATLTGGRSSPQSEGGAAGLRRTEKSRPWSGSVAVAVASMLYDARRLRQVKASRHAAEASKTRDGGGLGTQYPCCPRKDW